MSRKPKPTSLKRLQGNPGKRRLPKNEPKPDSPKRTPPPPDWLDETAANVWRNLCPQLLRLGLYTNLDRYTLAQFCAAAGRHIDAERELQGQPLTLEGSNGGTYQHPLLGISNRAMEQMRKLLPEFGLSPSARVRIQPDVAEPEKTLAEALFEAIDK